MNFIVNSTALARQLGRVAGAIPSKSMLPIIENFLFDIKENQLVISTTNLENSMQVKLGIESRGNAIMVAVPAKIVQDILKALPDQPLTFSIDDVNFGIEILSDTGKYKISGENGDNFPPIPSPADLDHIQIPTPVLMRAINRVLFAASNDEDRAALNGMLFNLGEEGATFVATDAHRLVRYIRPDLTVTTATKFIVPQKALLLIKNSLDSNDNKDMKVFYNENNAFFVTDTLTMVCRLIDQKYPNYENVIPQENPNVLFVSKQDLLGSLKRMNIFANKISHQVRFSLKTNEMEISAEDLDYANEAKEILRCTYDGEPMEIGFNATFLMEIVSNVETPNLKMEMSVPNRAGIVLPEEQEEGENMLMLIMPIMLNNY